MALNIAQKRAQLLALLIPAGLLGGAYISQYGFGLFPCEMCWWQRYPHFAGLGFAVLSFLAPQKKFWISLAAIAILISGLIAVFHAGVEWKFWEGITGCATIERSGGSVMDDIMAAPLTRCDEAPFVFLGLSLAGWNGVISIAGAAIIGRLLNKKGSL